LTPVVSGPFHLKHEARGGASRRLNLADGGPGSATRKRSPPAKSLTSVTWPQRRGIGGLVDGLNLGAGRQEKASCRLRARHVTVITTTQRGKAAPAWSCKLLLHHRRGRLDSRRARHCPSPQRPMPLLRTMTHRLGDARMHRSGPNIFRSSGQALQPLGQGRLRTRLDVPLRHAPTGPRPPETPPHPDTKKQPLRVAFASRAARQPSRKSGPPSTPVQQERG